MKIYLNNKKTASRKIRTIFNSIQDNKILQSKGGFLFKSSINSKEFHLGIIPVILEGERTHHYDINLDDSNEYIFSGFFNVDGTLGMLFTPPAPKDEITEDFRMGLQEAYSQTARLLIDNGFSELLKLDWITGKMIEEIGIYNRKPIFLKDLLISDETI